ncbi:MAG TPA: DUF6776 family protein [Gammaproteobacteria bacterium]|nr:DUF6776 family protein [Gammaproteobacteria bacterium]
MRTRLAIAGIATAVVAVVYIAFVYGEYRSGFDRQAAGALHDVLAQAQEDNAALKEQIAVLERQRDVDASSSQQVQQTLQELQRKLTDEQEQLAFYRGIVSPAAGEEGVRVESLKFAGGGAPRLYHYRLVLIQVRTREMRISGNVAVHIYGVQDGKPVILDARDLSPGDKPPYNFAFQYFQSLEGDVFLPQGFVPGRVEVSVHESGRDPVQQNFDWTSVNA